MNKEYYNLDKPVEQVIRHIIVKFSINDITITPFQSANVYVNLFNVRDEGVASQLFVMEGEAYNQWGDSDEYLIQWTRQQIENLYP